MIQGTSRWLAGGFRRHPSEEMTALGVEKAEARGQVAHSVFSCPEVASGDHGFPVWLHQWDLLHPPFPTPGSPQNAPADSPALSTRVRPTAPPPAPAPFL